MTCSACGNDSPSDLCSRCESETEWAGRGGSDTAQRIQQRIHEMRYDLTEALSFLPEEYAQLALFRLPGSVKGESVKRAHPGSRPPLNLAVLDLEDTREKPDADPTRTDYQVDRRAGERRQGVLPTLTSWVRLCDSEQWDAGIVHQPPADEPTVAGECGWLLSHVEWIILQGWSDEIVADVRKIRADVRRAIGEHDPIPLDCMRCGNPVEKVVINGDEDAAYWRCEACNAQWSRLELHHLELAQRPKTLPQLAQITEISVRTLQSWATRTDKRPPLIYPQGRDARGERTYSVKDVRAVALRIPSERKRKAS